MHRPSAVAAATAAVASLVLAPAAALAAEPVELGSGYVADEAGVLSSDELAAGSERLDLLRDDAGVEMWVVYVDAFTAPDDAAEWANATADLNNLGADQYLLAIATETRQMFLSPPVETSLSESDFVDIEQAAGDALRDDDWAGAITAAADELEDAATPSYAFLWVVLALVLIIAIVVGIVLVVRAAKRRRAMREERERALAELDELERRAAAAIIEMDDAVRTSRQEIGFALAQFGPDAIGGYEAAVADAAAGLGQAFELQRRIDDASEEQVAERRAWTEQILQVLDVADEKLDAAAAEFDELRRIEQSAPQLIGALAERRAAAETAPRRAEEELALLRRTYASPALDDVADNAEQARSRLAFVDEQLAQARTHLDAGDTGEAALVLREVEQALAQCDELVEGVVSLRAAFGDAERRATEIIGELRADIDRAAELADPDGRVAAAVAAARGHIDTATANLEGSSRTPLIMLRALEKADDEIDGVLQAAREAEEARRRAEQRADQQLAQAQARIAQAQNFIGTRRGAIGSTARTRIAEAQASLDRALSLRASDPQTAAAEAKRASGFAEQAVQAAHSDVSAYGATGYGAPFGYSSRYNQRRGYGRSSSGIGGDIVGGIIGGLVGGALSGGSSRGRSSGFGGFGGAGRSSFGRSGGISRSAGGRRSGGRRF